MQQCDLSPVAEKFNNGLTKKEIRNLSNSLKSRTFPEEFSKFFKDSNFTDLLDNKDDDYVNIFKLEVYNISIGKTILRYNMPLDSFNKLKECLNQIEG
jgi:hypothetical protein